MAAFPVNAVPALFVAYFGWRMYRRLIFRIAIYGLITLLFLGSSLAGGLREKLLVGLLAGLAVGVPLGWLGLRLTRFETGPPGPCYIPNSYLGVGLSMLLAARVAYRFLVFSQVQQPAQPRPQFMGSPLTLFIFGLLAGYYMTYYAGILIRKPSCLLPGGSDKMV
jgi:hypothetical protein